MIYFCYCSAGFYHTRSGFASHCFGSSSRARVLDCPNPLALWRYLAGSAQFFGDQECVACGHKAADLSVVRALWEPTLQNTCKILVCATVSGPREVTVLKLLDHAGEFASTVGR
jgi:hypothetical protein